MLMIIKDENLTESNKREIYRYKGLFKVISKLTKLLERLQDLDEYITFEDKERIRLDKVRELEQIIDSINQEIEYAEKRAYKERPIWHTGNVEQLKDKNK